MNDDERRLGEELRRLADEGAGTGTIPAAQARREIRRRQRVRAVVGGGLAATLLAGAAWGSVLLTEDRGPARIGPAQQVPAPPCDADATPPAPECATPTPRPGDPPEDAANPVLVFQLREGSNPYTKGSYAPSPRVGSGPPGTEGRLRAALQELVKGPTPQEEAAGFASMFSPKTADMIRTVGLTDQGRAVVEFGDFRDEIPNASAAEGGTILVFELNQTVFQFPEVQSVEYRIGESCDTFWEFLQAACTVVTRRDFENAP